MLQKDYIMRMIEQFGAFLARIVFNKENKNFDTALLEIDNTYRNLTGFDPKHIKNISEQQILNSISADNYLDVDRCMVIAELLREEAEIKEMQQLDSTDLFLKALYLYIQAIKNNEPYFMKYADKVDRLIEKLSDSEITDTCRFATFQFYETTGRYAKAEDELYELIDFDYPEIQKEGESFYVRLLQKSDNELIKGNLPRDEVEEGLNKMKK